MLDDYKITKPTSPVNLTIETQVIEMLTAMEKYKKISVSELANTALRRFIGAHKDFLPADYFEKNQNKLNNQR
jgi:acetylglutamate synthase